MLLTKDTLIISYDISNKKNVDNGNIRNFNSKLPEAKNLLQQQWQPQIP